MKRTLWFLFGLLVVGAILSSARVLFTPKIGTATRAQIEAALPASLRAVDAPDPEAERRYEGLLALLRPIDDRRASAALGSPTKPSDPAMVARLLDGSGPMIDGVEALLRKGPLRRPTRTITSRFDEETKLKSFAKLLAVATRRAAATGDRKACARLAALNLRYGRALLGDGVIIDALVAIAIESIAARAVYEADTAGGLDADGRAAALALLPVENGALPELGAAVRRDFQQMFLPVIVDPKRYLTRETVFGTREDGNAHDAPAGTFDPLETARLSGAIYDAGIVEASRTADEATGKAARLAEQAGAGVPQLESESNGMSGFWYRLRMNMGRNTLGRGFARDAVVFDGLAKAAQRRAANRNLVRAVLLLRMGRPADLPDPYDVGKGGKGMLRVDPKRRIVWSVGENGKDDGGDIGTTLGARAPDLGYRY